MRKKSQISFLIVVMYVFSLIMNTASVFASSVSGSSGSVPSGGGSKVSSGLSHLGTPVFRLGLTRDSGTYHNGTSASKVKVANNFSYRYPKIEKELFFVPHSVKSYYSSYGVLLYDNSSRKSNKFDSSSSPVYKSVLFMNDVSSSPGNKAKQALANYTFIDVSSSKYIVKLEKGVWKKQVSGITRQDALNFWSYVFKDVDNVRERFESLVSPHADKYGSSLSNKQKDDIAKGYLGVLIMAWVLAPSEYKAYWESGIEDFITQRDIQDKPVSFVFDTAMTLFFDGSSKRFIIPTIDFFEHYTSLSSAWDIENMTREKLGGSYDTYELLKRIVTKDIGLYPKTSRISDKYIAGNAFAEGAAAIVYPKKRFSTRPGYGTYFDTNLADAYMDMFSVGSTSDGKKIRGFMLTSYDLNLDTSGCEDCGDTTPDNLTLFLPLKVVVTPKNRVVNVQSEKINEKVKIVFSSGINGSSLNSLLDSFSKAKDKNASFKIRITIGSRNGAVQPAKYEGSVGGINKDFTLTYDQVISLLKGKTSLTFYDDTINEPISPNTEKKITYSNVSIQLTYKNLEGKTKINTRNINSDFASFKRPAVPPEPLVYTSKPRTYAEFKEGSPDNESFEAMAGVPSTKRLYLGVGGSEFIVDVEFEYMQNVNSVWRTYRSWFSGTPSEFKDGDNAKTATLGGYTVDLHNGGTYTKTWTGTIPNNGQDVTVNGLGSVTATSVAVPDYSEYNAKKAEAQQYVQQVNSTVLSHTSASDKKTRTYKNWGASITTDSKNPPQNTTSSNSCYSTDSKGNPKPEPCSTTATKAPDGNFTITVTFTVPAHVLCGPECTYDLPPVEDTWKQRINFDYMKIVRAEVFKLEKGRIVGVENVFGGGNNELKASIKSAVEPSIFVNIAQRNANGDDVSAQSSKHGRIRYSLETNQHDKVVWYEGVRSNKSAGEGRNGSSFAPQGGGHNNSWAKGILYTNPNYTTEKDYHRQKVTINTSTSNVADSIDVTTPEWRRFDERRKSPVVATIISDMLILQTSSGDQSVFYFDKDSQQVQAQEQFPAVRATKEEMWDNNPLSSANWTDDHIYFGSYNGHFGDSGVGSSNNKKYWGYDFEKDMFIDNASGGSRSTIETAFERYGTGVGVDGSVPRPSIPSKLYIWGDKDIEKTTMNGLHENEGAEVFYKELLNWRSPNAYSRYGNFPLQESAYKAQNQPNFDNIKGLVFDGLYSDDHDKVNDVVIHTPVSTEKAVVVSLPKSRDQRTELPEGSADSLIDEENKLKVCPLDPAKCEFRVLNCKYRHDKELAFFDFENTTPITILNKTTGAYLPYEMSNGMAFVNSPIGGFGQGKVLKATGTRFSLALSDLGVKVDRYERVLVEADIYIPSLTQDMMVFSFYKYDFYLPLSLNGQATLNTGNGVEKQILNENFINRVVRLGVEFSLGNIEDTKVYIDGVEVTKFKRVNNSSNSGQVLDLIGDKLNIGSWGVNDNYPANFYIDNLKVVKKGGLYNHTESCYIWTESHDTVWNHVHTSSCYPNGDTTKPPICKNLPMNTMTEANVHVHDSSCIYPNGDYNNGSSGVEVGTQYRFEYTGNIQVFDVPEDGVYKLQVWGAQGGSMGGGIGGYGGYAEGRVTLKKGESIFVAVGGQPTTAGTGGFNGGGVGGYDASGGGGATHIAKRNSVLGNLSNYVNDILIVAGGGGGGGSGNSSETHNGGHGGGTVGLSGTRGTGGSQTSGGIGYMNGIFGAGAAGYGHGTGGGGGFYGGGSGGTCDESGGGGSSYIGGVTDGITYAGNQSMPSISGGTQSQGKAGHGYAIITLESVVNSDKLDGYTYEEVFGANWKNYVKEGNSSLQVGKTYDYNYTGSVQQFTAPERGVYTFELWGAQGGAVSGSYGGKGGYVKGDIELNKGEKVYVYVGGKGGDTNGGIDGYIGLNNNGGFNGGGSGAGSSGPGGGGATDIRLGVDSMSNRVMVAGGGGGGYYPNSDESYASGGNTTNLTGSAMGENGCSQWFGSYESDTAGGGGGYYGGTSICGDDPRSAYGGSSYADSSKVKNITFTNGVRSGDGYLKITVKEVKGYELDWDKVKADVGKGFFPEYMWDGNINPLFKYCVPFFGDSTSNISIMKNSIRSNAVIETLKYPNTDKDVQVVRFNSGVVAEATSETFNLAKYATYTLTFDAWGIEDGRGLTVSVVGDSSLVKTFVIDKGVQKRLTFTFRSYLDESNARIKIRTDGSSGDVYVTNIRLFSQPIYNVHEHTVNCKTVKTLSCTEPHHFGAHYSADSSVCWDACGINENHQIQKKEVVKPDGSVVQAGTFVNLDYGFRLYFPNVGDFAQIPTMHGIPEVTQLRGKGFVNNMDTTEYTLSKYVKFGFDVIYEGKMYKAGSMISLPVNQDYYDFYCSLANAEALGASVEFEVVPINGQPIEDPKNENYEAVTNKERFEDYYSLHGAYKKVYVDVVGRIGNLVVSDTEDLRFSNFFKEPLSSDQWIVDGVLKKVNMYKQNKYYGDLVDIRGVPAKDTGVWLNTYGALSWLNKSPYSFPVSARDQSIGVLKEKFLKVGYDIFSDIQTIGSYQDGVIRVLPYYFKLNLDTGEITPLDAYVKVGGVYQPVNLYKGADGGTLPNDIYKTDIVMDWEEESYRRNFSMDESIITDRVAEYLGEPVTGLVVTDDGTEEGVTGYKRLTTPLGRYVKQGYPQRMVIDKKSRTFIGSSMTYGYDKNPEDVIDEIEFQKNAQRWYMKFSLPPSAEFVPAGLPPIQSSFDMVKKGNSVILLTADIVSLGNVYNLRYRQDWVDSITLTKEGVTRVFDIKSANLPPVIAIFDSEGNASIDISIRKSH